jgi:hypothetical protein
MCPVSGNKTDIYFKYTFMKHLVTLSLATIVFLSVATAAPRTMEVADSAPKLQGVWQLYKHDFGELSRSLVYGERTLDALTYLETDRMEATSQFKILEEDGIFRNLSIQVDEDDTVFYIGLEGVYGILPSMSKYVEHIERGPNNYIGVDNVINYKFFGDDYLAITYRVTPQKQGTITGFEVYVRVTDENLLSQIVACLQAKDAKKIQPVE